MRTNISTLSESFKKAATAGLMALIVASASAQQVAQQTAQPAPSAKPTVEEEQETSPAAKKPGVEGLKVHGHWIIDRKDKDGKLLEHRDFQNSLYVNASGILSFLLVGQYVSGGMEIAVMQGINGQKDTPLSGSTPISYVMYVAGNVNMGLSPECNSSAGINFHCLPVLDQSLGQQNFVTIPGSIPNSGYPSTVVLKGSFTATDAITVDTVQSRLMIGGGYVPPNPLTVRSPVETANQTRQAGEVLDYPFTGTGITPLAVASGQSLSITLTISFS